MGNQLKILSNFAGDSSFIVDEITRLSLSCRKMYIATPFFSNHDLLAKIIQNGCDVLMVVRLCSATSPKSLREALSHGALVRYVTERAFHPKMYLFDTSMAIVGSANFTISGLRTNSEISILLSDEETVLSLYEKFSFYWEHASVLDEKMVKVFEEISNRKRGVSADDQIDYEIEKEIGRISIPNYSKEGQKKNSSSLYAMEFKKKYQFILKAYGELQDVYDDSGVRKYPKVPIRIEIDSFINYIREQHAPKESWKKVNPLGKEERRRRILQHIEMWKGHKSSWWEETVIPKRYPKLLSVFNSEASLLKSSDADLFDALSTIHAFNTRFRYHGGEDQMRQDFFTSNSREKINKSLNYFAFGEDDIVVRMANLIFNSKYHIAWLGESSVKELCGWLNSDEFPIVNGRTYVSMHYLGFDTGEIYKDEWDD